MKSLYHGADSRCIVYLRKSKGKLYYYNHWDYVRIMPRAEYLAVLIARSIFDITRMYGYRAFGVLCGSLLYHVSVTLPKRKCSPRVQTPDVQTR